MVFFQFLIVIALAIFFVSNYGQEIMSDLVVWIADKTHFEPKNKITGLLKTVFVELPVMALGFVITIGLNVISGFVLLYLFFDFIVMPIWEHARDFFGWY